MTLLNPHPITLNNSCSSFPPLSQSNLPCSVGPRYLITIPNYRNTSPENSTSHAVPLPMTKPYSSIPRLAGAVRAAVLRPAQGRTVRCFSAAPKTQTDGVYRELTAMRTRIPFIEALRNQENGVDDLKPKSLENVQRDLSPKPMSDSHHRVVSHVEPLPLFMQVSNVNVDITTGSGSMASGLVYNVVWPYQTRDHFHGLGCPGRCGCVQAHRPRCHDRDGFRGSNYAQASTECNL